jgi:hypothetical protein
MPACCTYNVAFLLTRLWCTKRGSWYSFGASFHHLFTEIPRRTRGRDGRSQGTFICTYTQWICLFFGCMHIMTSVRWLDVSVRNSVFGICMSWIVCHICMRMDEMVHVLMLGI